mgnify:FL=1
MANGNLSEYYSILATAQQAGFAKDRKDRKDAEKEQDRRDDRNFLKSMVLKPLISAGIEGVAGAVKTSFEKKYEGFGKTQYSINQKVREDKAKTSSKAILKRMEEINATPTGKDSYYTDFGYEAAQKQATLANPQNAEYYKSEDARTFLTEQGNFLGDAQRKQDEKQAKLAREFLANGNLDDSLINQRSSGVFSSLIDIFQGDNAEKQDARAREQYESSLFAKGLNAVETYQGSLDEGVEWQVAAKNAAAASENDAAKESIKDYYANYEVTQDRYTYDADGNTLKTVITQKYSPRHRLSKGNKHYMTSSEESLSEKLTPETIAKEAKSVVKALNGEFNPVVQARNNFTTEAFDKFKAQVRKIDAEKGKSDPNYVKINIYDVKTIEQRKTMTDAFDQFDTEANMKTVATAKAREIARVREIVVRTIAADPIMMRNRRLYEDAVRDLKIGPLSKEQTLAMEELKQKVDADMGRVKRMIRETTEELKRSGT